MAISLRLLLIEDSSDDELMVRRLLAKSGFNVIMERVQTAETLVDAMTQRWDFIIADYRMPSFTGIEALKIVRQQDIDVPFILISGEIGEDIAVQAMRDGAQDYLMKQNLTRLGPAVERELRESSHRREKRQFEQSLRESEARYRLLVEHIPAIVFIVSLQEGYRVTFLNKQINNILGYQPDSIISMGTRWLEIIHPEDRTNLLRELRRCAERNGTLRTDIRFFDTMGNIVWFHIEAYVVPGTPTKPSALQGVMLDITETKQAEDALRDEMLFAQQLIDAVTNIVSAREQRILGTQGIGVHSD